MINYDKLAELHDQRLRFRATIQEIEFGGSHIRINNIIRVDTGLEVCEYMRLRYSKHFQKLDLKEGDVVEFDARVVMRMYYRSPMKNIRYKLDKPTKCVKVTQYNAL